MEVKTQTQDKKAAANLDKKAQCPDWYLQIQLALQCAGGF